MFVALVLQKTYIGVEVGARAGGRAQRDELVEANSKLGLISGVAGASPSSRRRCCSSTLGTLGDADLRRRRCSRWRSFSVAPAAAPTGRRGATPPSAGEVPSCTRPACSWRAVAMLILRAAVGFMFFHLAFWFRGADDGTCLLGVAVGLSSLGTMVGNAVAPRLRRRDPRGG